MLPNQAALWTDGANGLLLATNAAAAIRFAINGTIIGSVSPQGVGGFLNMDAGVANCFTAQFKNSAAGTTGQVRIGIATQTSSLINYDVANEVDIYGTSTVNFSVDNGTSMAFQIRAGGYIFAHGGYAGGATSFQGEASARPDQRDNLSGLLNLLGRPTGTGAVTLSYPR